MERDAWSVEQYERFKAERRQPFFDLLALVEPRRGMRVVDLGCGTGELTRLLHERLGAAETVGVDRSGAMLQRSAAFRSAGLRFVREDLVAYLAEDGPSYDLVFSNAALHWVDGHHELLRRLRERLAPGGQLAIQMPVNHDYHHHRVAAEVAREEPFRSALPDDRSARPVLAPEAYAELLFRLGFARQLVRMQVYAHPLESREQVFEWTIGTTLTRYKEALSDALYPEFEARYRERLRAALPDDRPFFFPFKRLLIWAGPAAAGAAI